VSVPAVQVTGFLRYFVEIHPRMTKIVAATPGRLSKLRLLDHLKALNFASCARRGFSIPLAAQRLGDDITDGCYN